MNHALETSSSFPYIAWAAIFAFSTMTVALALELEAEMTALASNRDYIETMLKQAE